MRKKKKHASFFAGIGGFDKASQEVGWENVLHCEIGEFGSGILGHYWPHAIGYGDIKKTDFTIWRGLIDVLSGGFPCQPYSLAGERKGKEDPRHLWPEMLRAIIEIQPGYVVGENVFGLLNWGGGLVFHEIQADLEAAGYEVLPYILPACGVGAPHRRDRIWFVARRISATLDSIGGGDTGRVLGTGGKNGQGTQPTSRDRLVADTRHDAKGETGNSGGDEREGSSIIYKEGQERNGETILNPGLRGIPRTPSDTGGDGHEHRGLGEDRQEKEEIEGRENQWERVRDDIGGDDAERLASDTDLPGCKREREQPFADRDIGHRVSRLNNFWEEFPTQSPVCSGDDGIPTELLRQRIREDCMGVISEKEIDQILSKAHTEFRNETIKAYGNAIVHQVAVEIFQVIDFMLDNPITE